MRTTSLLSLLLLFLPSSLAASTQAGELVVVKTEGNHYTGAVMFNEYFSGPREFFPGMHYSSKSFKSPGAFMEKHSVADIDGRMVKPEILFRAMQPGRRFYQYGSRHTLEFVYLYSHELPVQGHLKEVQGSSVELRRFMTRRFDTGTPVFQLFRAEIEDDALYFEDGQPSTKGAVLKKAPPSDYVLRVFPAQKRLISAFHPESTAELEEFGPDHQGARTGFILETGNVTVKGKKLMGVKMKIREGANFVEQEMGIDRKGYMVLDGRHIPWRSAALRKGAQGTGATYRGWEKAKYFLVRSPLVQAWDGVIESISSLSIQVKRDDTGKVEEVSLNQTLVTLDGLKSSKAELKNGMPVTVFNERPQVIEGMNECWPNTKLERKTEKKGETKPYMIIEYDLEGRRRVIREGLGPYWEDERSAFNSDHEKVAGKRYPMPLTKFSREEVKAAAKSLTPPNGPFHWTIPEQPSEPWK